jgi:enamine deaminase RidA (YjgF/YER057c/UK114 family)
LAPIEPGCGSCAGPRAGARVDDVVRTVMYVTDIGDAELVGRAHREVFGEVRPASTMVQVSGLIRPEIRVEIEAYAVIDEALPAERAVSGADS